MVCDSVLQEVVRLVMPVVRRTATSWVLADVVTKALGAMLPKHWGVRDCNARGTAPSPNEAPSQNTGHRTQYGALEA